MIGNLEVLRRTTEADEKASAEAEAERGRLAADAARLKYRSPCSVVSTAMCIVYCSAAQMCGSAIA